MARPPIAPASLNMSACSAHAMSQVGWRLMVASRAKISRPAAAFAFGAIAFTCARKAAISAWEDDATSPASAALAGCALLWLEAGVLGSFAIAPTKMPSPPCGDGGSYSSMASGRRRPGPTILVRRTRRILRGNNGRLLRQWLFIVEELGKPAGDAIFHIVRPAIFQVGVVGAGHHQLDAFLLAVSLTRH